jgi:glycosyltransferase involved in cell wall biosynthesis
MKPFIVVQGPVRTRSGYGNHTRDLVTALIKANKYDIALVSLPWGNTPMNALEPDNPNHQAIEKRIAKGPINRQADIFIQISVPNEFRPAGKYNIGVTAGIETTIVPHDWIEGCNKMDLIISTSEHSKKGLQSTSYDKIDKKTKQKTGILKLEKPVEVLFEGVDLDVYKKVTEISKNLKEELSDVKDDFCYLFVGHWLKGMLGQDRKDIGMMLKTFCETFKRKSAKNRPGIILKTSHATFSIIDREEIYRKIQEVLAPYGNNIPNIYLLHGDLTDKEMNELYNHPKVKAMVSFTKGEGFGRPLLEFSMTGKPIIASGFSGQLDFLHKDYSTLLPGELTQVHPSAADQFILKESQWFTVNYAYPSKVLMDVMDNYKLYLNRSRKQGHYSRTEFSLEKMNKLFCEYVDKGLEGVPKQVGLKLPKLKKTSEPKSSSIKLPKLKKVNA